MSELKPCPFCGGKAVGFEWSDYDYWEEGEPHDEDAFCDVKVDHKKDCILELGEFNLWAANTEEEAEKLWNTRANECDSESLLELADELETVYCPDYGEFDRVVNRIREDCGVKND